MKPGHGPSFGDGDLVLETMSKGFSQLGNSFEISAHQIIQFAETTNFDISDVEVLHAEGNYSNVICLSLKEKCLVDFFN